MSILFGKEFMVKKILLCCVVFLFSSFAFCESAEIVFAGGASNGLRKSYSLRKMSDGAMRLRVPVCDIPRDVKKLFVYLQRFQAQKGEDGYFIIPTLREGNMGLFKFDDASKVYRVQMPFWGVKTPRGTTVAIAKGLALEYFLIEEVKGGVHKLFPRYNIDKIDFDPYEDVVIDFYDLGKEATYVDMAKKYRAYQLERGEVVPLKERVKNNQTLKYSVESPFVRIKMAVNKRPKGLTDANSPLWDKIEHSLDIFHTFDSFIEIMKKMNVAGVKEADVCFVGWQTGGFDGYFPDLFPVEERLGGEAKMREAVEIGKSLGYHMTTHINNHNMYKRAKRWSENDVSKNRKGEPRTYVVWPGGQAYHTCFQTICDRFIDSDIAKLKDMGMNAPQHVDVTSAITPTPCCDPLHPNNRKQMAEHQIRLGEKYRDIFGGFTSEAGFDHVAKVLDYALYTSCVYLGLHENKKGDTSSLTERDVLPLWQIVYHGIILSNVDWYTIDCYLKPKGHDYRLKFIEAGGRPTFYWTRYKKQKDIDAIAEAYREYVPMRYLQYEFIERHERLTRDVVLVGYSDGSEVVVNYGNEPFTYKGKNVPARDYKLFKVSKK